MDQQREDLARAERHLALAQGHVQRQREIVAELLRDGHDVTLSRDILRTFEESLALHAEHYDRLLKLHSAARDQLSVPSLPTRSERTTVDDPKP